MVVRLRPDAVGVTGYQRELELGQVLQPADYFAVDRSLPFGFQDSLVEVEQRLRGQRDLLYGRRGRRRGRWRRAWRWCYRAPRGRRALRNQDRITPDHRHPASPVPRPPHQRIPYSGLSTVRPP